MDNLGWIGIVVATLVVIFVGGGGAYLIWVKTRPKKITWKAKVFQVSEGVQPATKDLKGNILSNISLSDLRPYTEDVIEKIEKAPGITLFRLVKLNKTVPAVTSDCVDYWGEKKKEVWVVMEGDTFTLLKKGYDRNAGAIFRPMNHDRINMIKGEMAVRKDRLKKEKDILVAITPWVVAGICMMGLVTMTFFVIEGFKEINDLTVESQRYTAEKTERAALLIASAMAGNFDPTVGLQPVEEGEPPPEAVVEGENG